MGCSQFLVPLGGNFCIVFCFLFCGANCAWPCPAPTHFSTMPAPSGFFGHSRGCLWLGFVKNGNYVKK